MHRANRKMPFVVLLHSVFVMLDISKTFRSGNDRILNLNLQVIPPTDTVVSSYLFNKIC